MSEPGTIPDLPRRSPGPLAEQAATATHGDPTTPSLTGDAAVDAAVADLDALDPGLEPGQQLPVLAAVHEALQQRLSSTEG